MNKEKKKLNVEDLKVESFASLLSDEELAQVEAAGGGTYGPCTCPATNSYNCYNICKDNQGP